MDEEKNEVRIAPMCGRCGHQEEFHWGIIGSLNCSILGCECKNFELQEYHCMICQKAITVYYSVLHQGNPTWCVECYNKNQPTVITDEQMKSLPRQIMTQDYTCIKCGAKATGSPSDEAWMCMDCYQKGNKKGEKHHHYCSKCGQELHPDFAYSHNCGKITGSWLG